MLILAIAAACANFTWYPDPSGGTAAELAPADAAYSNPRAWSPDGRHVYKAATHHPVANVLVENTSDTDGCETVNAYITYLDAPGGPKDLGMRGGTKVFVRAKSKAQAVVNLEYSQFAAEPGDEKASKGRYVVKFGPGPDDIRVTTDITLAEDIFFNRIVRKPAARKQSDYNGPRCTFAKTPTPCETFLKRHYGKMTQDDYSLLDRAVRTFEWNALGKTCQQKIYVNNPPWAPLRGVNPSSAWFKGIWNWDSAFIMMATRRWDPELARDQMRLWMLIQKEDGCYPDSWTEGDGIQFAPSFTNSKPPVFAWAMWQLHKTAPDRKFLATAYDSLRKNEGWWRKNRLNGKYGLFHYDGRIDEPDDKRRVHSGYESGWDDSPRWDGDAWHVLAIDLNAYLALTYRALRDFARELGRGDDVRLWTERGAALEKAIEDHLWDERDRCYYDRNFVTGAFNRSVTPASFMPLLVGTASQERADEMAKQATHLEPGWPSVAYDDPMYDPMGYWRGRTWLNVAYMALKGLAFYGHQEIADRGRKTLLEWVRNDPSAIYETYNSRTGLPCGASHFSWSCTFVISFLLDWNMPRDMEMPAPFLETEKNPAWVVRSWWMDGWTTPVSATKTKRYDWTCPGDGKYDVTGEIMAVDDSVFTGRILLNGKEIASGRTVGSRSLGIVAAQDVALRKGDKVAIELAGTEKDAKKMNLDAFAVRRRDTVRTKCLSGMDDYHALPRRRHQGIPSVAVSKGGRLWATWYCNVNGCETADNFAVLATSADDGKTWKEVLVADPDLTGLKRAFDPEIWVTPDNRLLWTWSERVAGIYAFGLQRWSGCGADPASDKLCGVYLDAESEPDLSALPEPFEIAGGVMMCKPIARKDGSWLLPVAHWFAEPSSLFYESRDNGRTFTYLGGATVPTEARTFDEQNVVELADGTLKAWMRTAGHHGIPGLMESVSKDGGRTWTLASRAKVPQCSSRVFVTKLRSGNLVMVKNGAKDVFTDRQRLTAILSRDGGETWEGGLLLDERKNVSYPDGCEMPDGSVMVIYDRNRTEEMEILTARFTEADILAGGKAAHAAISGK